MTRAIAAVDANNLKGGFMNGSKPTAHLGPISLAMVALLVVGCDFGSGHMMGSGRFPASYTSNGERIYFTGTSASGELISGSGGNAHMAMMGGGCASCHGADRLGARMMPQFWELAPPLTRAALFEHHDDGDGHGDHDRYRDDTLQRAVFEGVDAAGKPLDEAMPHWSMSDRDWHDLLEFLRS